MVSLNFEETLQKLQSIVDELQAGDLPLEKAIKKYNEGMQLSKKCAEFLHKAQQQIDVCIKGRDGSVQQKPFKERKRARKDS